MIAKRTWRQHSYGPAMVSVRQRSANFFVRYTIVDADRHVRLGPLGLPGSLEIPVVTWAYCLVFTTKQE